ncbi:MAG: hypothetical protein ACLUKN_15270 [Bacilli bacterium]
MADIAVATNWGRLKPDRSRAAQNLKI